MMMHHVQHHAHVAGRDRHLEWDERSRTSSGVDDGLAPGDYGGFVFGTGQGGRSAAHSRQSSRSTNQSRSMNQQRSISYKLQSHSQISPPLTPRESRESLSQPGSEITFHNFLRAFYPFHPSSTVSSSTDESSITVPINQGDVILVHSVHPNGWADGTLLVSGARGWLPTNYCEPYDHSAIRNLLNALTHLWDLVRTNEHETLVVFSRHDYVRGMIAGVRTFLVGVLRADIFDSAWGRKLTNVSGANVLSFAGFVANCQPRWSPAVTQGLAGRPILVGEDREAATKRSSQRNDVGGVRTPGRAGAEGIPGGDARSAISGHLEPGHRFGRIRGAEWKHT